MEWNSSYSIGVQAMDEQHKKWIDLLNQLNDAMRKGKAQDVLDSLLGKVADYVKTHFASEEALCAKHGYPEAERHKGVHTAYAKSIRKLHDEFKAGKRLMSIQVMDAMQAWLVDHIMKEDKKYGAYLNRQGVH